MTRIAWFHPRPLLPLAHGGNLRTYALISCALAEGHEVLLITPEGDQVVLPGLVHHQVEVRRGLGGALAKVLSLSPLRSPRPARRGRSVLARRLAEYEPELAVVSEIMAWSLARSVLGTLPLIYDSPNVESELFQELMVAARALPDRVTFGIDARRVRSAENELLHRSLVVLAASEDDAATFAQRHGAVQLVPHSVAAPDRVTDAGDKPLRCMYVGGLSYPPNRTAVQELLEDIWPDLRRRTGASLEIIGRGAEPSLRARIAGAPGVTLREDVDDLGPWYATTRCVVLPLRLGGGTSLKVFEALAHGVPLVATPTAVRGVELHPGEAVVAEDSGDLIAGAEAILTEDDHATRVGRAGRARFDESLSWEAAVRPALRRALERAEAAIRP